MNNTTDSGKLIEHIEEAKGWLDKAKEQVQTNPVHGELILNLAQAEVKCAWELTHNQNVSNNIKKLPNKRNQKWNYYIPAAAASIIIVSGLVFGLQFGKVSTPEKIGIAQSLSGQDIETKVTGQNTPAISEQNVDTQMVAKSKVEPESNEKQRLVSKPNPKKAIPKNIMVAKTDVVEEPDPEVSNMVPVSVSGNQTEPVVVPKNELEHERADQTPTKAKPVSQISIDVEALTQEASQSLRKGK